MDYTILIGGEAGQGVQTVGETLGRVFARSGYHVFTHQDYESRVRGGHNFYQIRFCDAAVTASHTGIDLLVAFDKETIPVHGPALSASGIAIYDSATLKQVHEGPRFLDVPFSGIAQEKGSRIMANTAAVGAVLGILGIDLAVLSDILKETFHGKGDEVVNSNISVARAGFDRAKQNCSQCSFSCAPQGKPKFLIAGSDAIGLGAAASGIRFYSAYPMTPSTGIMNYLADKSAEFGIVVEQAEDEISAVNMALGASFAGVRAMTGTSGGGFCLMVEGLALAAMTETPLVVVLAQRPGPATGFPTRTEQGELLFAMHAGHGEFPRVIFAPGSPQEAIRLTNKACELAEKYQITSVVMTDQYLADSQWTYDEIDLSGLASVDYRVRGHVPGYSRHRFTENGVSPLAVPGEGEGLVVTDSDEHDEDGHIVEDADTRIRMVEKRLFLKLPRIRQEMGPPKSMAATSPR